MWPTERSLLEDDTGSVDGEVAMESVEHLGKYVYEMTGTRIKQLESERGVPMGGEVIPEEQLDEDEEGEGDEDVPLEPDILEVREGEA
jgi:intron-binding protein aquarius